MHIIMPPLRGCLLLAAFIACGDVLPRCGCESPNGRVGTAMPTIKVLAEGGRGLDRQIRSSGWHRRRLWNVLRLRGGGGRGSRPSKNLVVGEEDELEELNKFVEGRRNKIHKAMKLTKRKWIGKEPVAKSVVNRWKGQNEQAKKKEDDQAYEPKFVQHVRAGGQKTLSYAEETQRHTTHTHLRVHTKAHRHNKNKDKQ